MHKPTELLLLYSWRNIYIDAVCVYLGIWCVAQFVVASCCAVAVLTVSVVRQVLMVTICQILHTHSHQLYSHALYGLTWYSYAL